MVISNCGEQYVDNVLFHIKKAKALFTRLSFVPESRLELPSAEADMNSISLFQVLYKVSFSSCFQPLLNFKASAFIRNSLVNITFQGRNLDVQPLPSLLWDMSLFSRWEENPV